MKAQEVTVRLDIERSSSSLYHLRVIMEYDYDMGFIFKKWYTRGRLLSHKLFSEEEEVMRAIEDVGGAQDYIYECLVEKTKQIEGDVGDMLNKYQGTSSTIMIGGSLLQEIEKITPSYRRKSL